MPRHDNDQWDIVTSVGLTALAVAACRAIETKRADALIQDPFADALVSSAGTDFPVSAQLPHRGPDDESDFEEVWTYTASHMGVRSRFFDNFLHDSWHNGVTQAVILASGLDARAWRLDWPEGCSVYEIDQPKVLAYKDDVLAEEGARPRCARHAVAIDLREDWSAALERSGFDRSRPTAWLAEGLLPYLPDHAEEGLLKAVHELSAPGSRIAVEHMRAVRSVMQHFSSRYEQLAEQWGLDINDLFYDNDQRPDPDDRLAELGWQTNAALGSELAQAYGRTADGVPEDMSQHLRYVTAQLLPQPNGNR
ncbi:SAM-dependent methyltransferase [Saccharopolyspora sp. K220]|uniref:SAM-dependent methyltransferase n=1 Tax=Saccharopolyspora soli TaxID=2926618 RepID=UPI001F585099|nr:SAM-dependent methyltransferase [Saccharopolyspora soli]MCI2416818.1 SAM-dependent methyltransferase [Saccharopolyspora soli]